MIHKPPAALPEQGLLEFQEPRQVSPSLMALYPLIAALAPKDVSRTAQMLSVVLFGYAVREGPKDEYTVNVAQVRRWSRMTDSRLKRMADALDELQRWLIKQGMVHDFDMPAGQSATSEGWLQKYTLAGAYIRGTSGRSGSSTTLIYSLGSEVQKWVARFDHLLCIDMDVLASLKSHAESALYFLALAVSPYGETGHQDLNTWLKYLSAPEWMRKDPKQFMSRMIRKPLKQIAELTGMTLDVKYDPKNLEAGFNLLVRPSLNAIERRAERYFGQKQSQAHKALAQHYESTYQIVPNITIGLIGQYGYEAVSLAEVVLEPGLERAKITSEKDKSRIENLGGWAAQTLRAHLAKMQPVVAHQTAVTTVEKPPLNRVQVERDAYASRRQETADWFKTLGLAAQKKLVGQAIQAIVGEGGLPAKYVMEVTPDTFDYTLAERSQTKSRGLIISYLMEHQCERVDGVGI